MEIPVERSKKQKKSPDKLVGRQVTAVSQHCLSAESWHERPTYDQPVRAATVTMEFSKETVIAINITSLVSPPNEICEIIYFLEQ